MEKPMATTIDSTWLTNNGPAPYLLSTDNEVYTLAADVKITSPSTFNGPVFKLTGKNVYLNLNGFRVYINGWAVDQNTSSFKSSQNEVRAISSNQINNTTGGKFLLGEKMSNINVDPTDKEKQQNS
jgi:hypothetical protein